MDNNDRIREFPVTENWIYLDHAAVAPLPSTVANAMREIIVDVEQNGIVNVERWRRSYDNARNTIAKLIGANPLEIAFTKNTTDGLLLVANGIDWHEGDNVILGQREFPANVYPWLNLSSRGVKIKWVLEQNARLSVADFAAAIDERTRILSVSSVEFFTGFRNDLERLGELCRHQDILFVVDGIQSVGAIAINVSDLGIDCLAADGHKWLLGPEGCALFYCSAKALSQLRVSALGWASVKSYSDFLDYSLELQNDARRFETGTQNTIGLAGLAAAAENIINYGQERAQIQIIELTDHLCELLITRGYKILSPRNKTEKSGIVSFRHPHLDSSNLQQHLRDKRIISTSRGGYLRFSPHYYNTEDEISTAVGLLPH